MRNQRSSQPKPSSRAAGLGLTFRTRVHASPLLWRVAGLASWWSRSPRALSPSTSAQGPREAAAGDCSTRPRWLQVQHARLWDRRVRQASSGSAAHRTPPQPSSQEGRAHRVRTGEVVPGGRSVDDRGRSHRGNSHSNGSARPLAPGRQMRLRNPRTTALRIPFAPPRI